MLHLFLGLKSLVKVSRFHTDCSVFRLHYRATVVVLLAFTFIVTSRHYVGSAIMCIHTDDIPKDVRIITLSLSPSPFILSLFHPFIL